MVKNVLIVALFSAAVGHGYAQSSSQNIFEINSQSELVLKPEIEKKIEAKIKPIINKKIDQLEWRKIKEDGRYYSKKGNQEEYDFARDTIYISEFMNEFDRSYSAASSTQGMNWMARKRLKEYDKLLNKYYQKALGVLAPETKQKLVNSQRKWLSFYENEKEFIYHLNDFGNHNSSLYCWGYYEEMLKERVLFLRDIYLQKFENGAAFISDK